MSADQQFIANRPVAPWAVLTVLSLMAGVGWVAYIAMSIEGGARPPFALVVGVGNCIVGGFTGSLMGLFAARKNRNPYPWAFGFGVPALILGLFPLLAGAIAMSCVPHAEVSDHATVEK